jgi:nucleoredoxin
MGLPTSHKVRSNKPNECFGQHALHMRTLGPGGDHGRVLVCCQPRPARDLATNIKYMHMRKFGWSLVAIGILALVARAETQTITKELTGKLVALNSRITQPSNSPAIGQAKYVAFYYGAGWCGPCHKFTPDLIAFYKEMKPKYPEFEVVFVSRDNSSAEIDSYMAEMKMPWPAVRYDAIKWSTANKYSGPGIPCLVLVDQNGRVLSDSYQGNRYLGPHKVLDDLRNLLSQNQAVAAAANSISSPSPSPATRPTPPSPSGTNWDQVSKKPRP